MKTKPTKNVTIQMDPDSEEFKAKMAKLRKLVEARDGSTLDLYVGGYRNKGQ